MSEILDKLPVPRSLVIVAKSIAVAPNPVHPCREGGGKHAVDLKAKMTRNKDKWVSGSVARSAYPIAGVNVTGDFTAAERFRPFSLWKHPQRI